MTLRRGAPTWVAFALCLLLLFGAVAALTGAVLWYDRQERITRQRATAEADIRLALWRMESAMQPLIARESARPPEHWRALVSRRLPDGTTVEVPSPLLGERPEHVLLHFRIGPDGSFTSPQANVDLARAAGRLARLQAKATRASLIAAMGAARPKDGAASLAGVADPGSATSWQAKNAIEYQMRWQSVDKATNYGKSVERAAKSKLHSVIETAGPMTPVWIEGELLLVRRIRTAAGDELQGAWLDWDEIRGELTAAVADLLPAARIVRASPAGKTDHDRRLASLPLVLAPGAAGQPPGRGAPLYWMLAAGWGGVLLAAVAATVLLVGTIALSNRRAAFVSAVTHELRTPLTTLRTYTEMLADGRVTDEDRRQRYLEVLQRESARLGHLIENVLSYSQIEQGKGGLAADTLDAGQVLDGCAPRLSERAAEAGMELEISVADDSLRFLGDGIAVEQILFNLVDNACKYAAAASERRILLRASGAARGVRFSVTDFGPGIPEAERAKIFAPFHKTAEKAAVSAPGVGLGLSLCRRLARAMRAELVLEPSPGGETTFSLTLLRA